MDVANRRITGDGLLQYLVAEQAILIGTFRLIA
jgi:hypothetical protein